jgi:hypothetical protein
MNRLAKFAIALGLAGILALASTRTSQAQWNGFAAIGLGFAANYYYGSGYRYGHVAPTDRRSAPGYASDPAYAYTGDPAYANDYGYAVSPWQERRLRGSDY